MSLKVKNKYPVPRRAKSHHTLPQRMVQRQRRRSSISKLIMTVVSLILLAIVAGTGYTWYMGTQRPVAAEQTLPVVNRRVEIKPQKISSTAPIGASVQAFTSEVKPGENASVTIRTNPEAECSIVVKYNKVAAVDSGLVTKDADDFGVVSWAWTVKPGTPPGLWPAEMTCKNKKNSAFVKAEFMVK